MAVKDSTAERPDVTAVPPATRSAPRCS